MYILQYYVMGLFGRKKTDKQLATEWNEEGTRIGTTIDAFWDPTGMRRKEQSLKCYDEAIKLDPECFNAWFNKGGVLGELEKYEESITCFHKAIQLNTQKELHSKNLFNAWCSIGCSLN